MFAHYILALVFAASARAMPNRRTEGFSPEIFFRSVPRDFPKLKFADSECNSTKGRKGICVGYPECRGEDAVREGSCSGGFGTCCVYLLEPSDPEQKTESTVSDWGSFFSNPDFPSPTPLAESSVQIRIEQDVCQIRLDFEELDLPDNTVFKTSVSGTVVAPILSGNNTGQHMIVNVGDESPRQAWIVLSISGPFALKTWNIHLTNVFCYSSLTAPAGCTQYFLSPIGRIRSLSVNSVESSSYAVCLRSKNPRGNLLSLRSFASGATCGSSVQIPAGVAPNGGEVPARICANDNVQLSYKVSGPLVLYMKAAPGRRGVEFQYDL